MNRTSFVLAATLLCWAGPAVAQEQLKLTEPSLGGPLTLNAPPMSSDTGGGDDTAPMGGGGGSGRDWFMAGKTLGGGDGILVQFGWPGISFEYLHSNSSTLDIGGTFTFNYGYEGTPHLNPGILMQFALRLQLLERGRFNMGLRFDPGLDMYFVDPFRIGLTMPVAIVFGLSIGDAMMLNFGLDVPMTIFYFTSPNNIAVFNLTFLFSAGLEYHVDSHLSLSFNARVGPTVAIDQYNSNGDVAFWVLFGIGYHF